MACDGAPVSDSNKVSKLKNINDFSSFDAKQSDYFCLITPKGKKITQDGIDQVYAFGHTAFNARALGLLFFENVNGYQLDYDQLICRVLEVSKIGKDEIVLFKDSNRCGIQIYKTTEEATIAELLEKKNVKKWKPLHKNRIIEPNGN